MNFHLPQMQQARAEAATIMAMPNHILTAQSNDTICGIVQDGLIASYLMTRRGEYTRYITLQYLCDLSMYVDNFDFNEFGRRVNKHFATEKYFIYSKERKTYIVNKKVLSRRGLPAYLAWSMAFPKDFYFENYELSIKDGLLLKGTIAKRHIGPHGILSDRLAKYYNGWVAAEWMSNVENITNIWLASHGFSIGVDDFLVENDSEILETMAGNDLKYEIIKEDQSKSDADKEHAIMAVLNSTISVGERLAKKGMNHGEDNALNIFIKSKAKGTFMNITQIAAAMGQQNLTGGRIPKTINQGKRCLPYFEIGDDSPAARGFISSNLIDGLHMTEAAFHSLGGREGLIDTACKTKETGYLQRSLIKTNEDIVIGDNHMVMAYNHIIQFCYNNDNFDGKYLSKVKFPNGKISLFFCDPEYIAKQLCTKYSKEETTLLSQEEIDKLLSIVSHPLMNKNVEHIDLMLHNIKNRFSQLLHQVLLPCKKFHIYYEMCKKMYNKAVIDIGESVGILAAEAIGEMSTQSTLNTFHSSGGEHKAVTQGVPRLKEIKNGTAKPKSRSVQIYLKEEEWPTEDLDLEGAYHFMAEYSSQIKEIKLEKIIDDIRPEIFAETTYPHTDPLGVTKIMQGQEEWWETEYMYNLDLKEDEIFVDELHCGYRIKIQFDKQALYDHNVTIFNLAIILEKRLTDVLRCIIIPSPSQEAEIVIYFSLMHEALKIVQSLGDKKHSEFAVLNEENIIYLCLRDILIPMIKGTLLNKETGVNRYFVETNDTENIKNHEKYFIETEGGNFETILGLECIDTRKCKTDDFWQVYHALDIEAAKRCLTEEFYKALTGDGSYIDRRLVALTVDNLCRRGTIDSMRRDSVPMEITGPIQKMAFEKPVHYIMQSVIHGVLDPCVSAAGCITLGNNPQVGTEKVKICDENGTLLENFG